MCISYNHNSQLSIAEFAALVTLWSFGFILQASLWLFSSEGRGEAIADLEGINDITSCPYWFQLNVSSLVSYYLEEPTRSNDITSVIIIFKKSAIYK